MAFIDITGQKFGMITVNSHNRNEGKQGSFWNCTCDCGNTKVIRAASLKNGKTKSCGCMGLAKFIKMNTKHGLHKKAENQIWRSMKYRCVNTKHKKTQRNYKDRGIMVCQGWKDSFESFYSDMGDRPSDEHSIERKDNNGNYSCGHCEECIEKGWGANCIWATIDVQNRNHRRNHWIEYKVEKKILTDWAHTFGIDPKLLDCKLRRGKQFEWIAQQYI